MTASHLSRLALLAASLAAGTAMADDLKPVTLTVGTSVLNVGYPMLTLPLTLGYWEKEGYKVSLQPAGASLQALQQMVAGNAQFAEINASVAVQANVDTKLPVRVAMANGVLDWSVAVPQGSPIKSVADLKGKTVGIFSLATGGLPMLKSYLKANGVDPDKDVTFIPTGFGAQPVEALKSGKVDALMYWASANAGMENAGLKLDYIYDPAWRQMTDYSLTVMQDTAKKDPAMVIAIARGVAEATVFALANPECAVKLQWQEYPETKPKAPDEATAMAWDLNNINAQLATLKAGYELDGSVWGQVDTGGLDRLQNFLAENGVTKGTLPADDYLTGIPDFAKQVNDFDADAIRAAARSCTMLRG